MKLKRVVSSVRDWWFMRRVARRHGTPAPLSPAARAALRTFLTEQNYAVLHQQGLDRVRLSDLARPTKINLGSGRQRKEGFLNVDLHPRADVSLDLRQRLPFDSDCCELIFSEHCFEHFDYPQPIGDLFVECLRVLKPVGELSFSVPGTEWPLQAYFEGPESEYFRACREHAWHPDDCTTRMEHINYHFRQGSEHRFAYDFETAEKLLTSIGFVDVRNREFDPQLDSTDRRVGSLFVSARKPG